MEPNAGEAPDLTGTADDRLSQLSELDDGQQSSRWLRRQLVAALEAWGADESALAVDEEGRADF